MAFAAFVLLHMDFVAELHITQAIDLKRNVSCRVAGRALADTEGFLAIVAGAAGFAVFHFSH